MHLSMGDKGTLIVTQCFENQLVSVQTSSQIHLNLIESRALEFQPNQWSYSPEAPYPKQISGMAVVRILYSPAFPGSENELAQTP